MKRLMTGFGFAAAFGLVATLSAQTTSSSATSTTTDKDEVTITGCLERGANGNYTLVNAQTGSESGASATTTGTSGTTTATGTSGSAGTTAGAMNATSGSTWTLEGDNDLAKHVGHKVQVTGKEVSSSKDDHEASATTTTAGTSGSGTTTATGTTGTTGTSGSAGAAEQRHSASDHAGRKLDVKSVKMISSSCS
jgi:hypothetical protein